MASLLCDDQRRAVMNQAALEYARGHSFDRVAEAYLGALGLL
jgi:hypothetical protein